jgi:hypothetical protein
MAGGQQTAHAGIKMRLQADVGIGENQIVSLVRCRYADVQDVEQQGQRARHLKPVYIEDCSLQGPRHLEPRGDRAQFRLQRCGSQSDIGAAGGSGGADAGRGQQLELSGLRVEGHCPV